MTEGDLSYACRKLVERSGDGDPRTVATLAAVRDARRPDRLFEPGGRPLPNSPDSSFPWQQVVFTSGNAQ